MMDTNPAVIDPADHIRQIFSTTTEVLGAIQTLDASRCGPAPMIEVAATELAVSMTNLAQLGPSGGFPSLSMLEQSAGAPSMSISAGIRQNVARIREQCASLTLELRRHLAECRDILVIATGAPGTYDSMGRTTTGDMRRVRGSV
ncbi:MAG TPA: hypothetical protein VGM78_06515 [Ilumatobacteraceae bacterium]|jgi:hypothetical protein